MNSTRWNGRQTVSAGLLSLVLLLGSLASAPPSAHADGGAHAVFYGYVVLDQGAVLPKRVRALAEHSAVCGSADVVATGTVGFYVIAVVSSESKEGCPALGEPVRFALVYGLIDEGSVVGPPATFRAGEVTQQHLILRTADARPTPLIP